MPQPPELGKVTWTEADFEQMGWHDARVVAFAVRPETYEVEFDLDYIVEWVDPSERGGNYSFWSAPATLVFENVRKLVLHMEPDPPEFEIIGIERDEPSHELPLGTTPWGSTIRGPEWRWQFDLGRGTLSFRSTGYQQYFRRPPLFVGQQQQPTLAQRGGISFARAWNSKRTV